VRVVPVTATRWACAVRRGVYNRRMTTSGIPSARKKLERANVHLAALHRAVDEFREQSPYAFAMESPGNQRWKPDIPITVTVTTAPSIPDGWALIAGDILTNARAALDHAVFPHIRAKKPELDRKLIHYPIEDRKEQWENKNRWFERPVLKVVGDSQPYRHADPVGHPLRVLRELVNMDKHRDLVIANYAVDDFVVPPQDLFEVVSTTVHITEMLPGAIVARARLRLVQDVQGERLVQCPCYVDYGEKIEVPGSTQRLGLLSVMDQIVKPIGGLFDELEQAGC
jgi:hypothetical protein